MRNFTKSLTNYKRRLSDEITIGALRMGKTNPIRIQSMTNTNTLDTSKSLDQCIRIIKAGGELVRLTTQGVREAENLKNIKIALEEKGYNTPIIADVHFNPKIADAAATIVEKVRINPGNYSEKSELEEKFKAFLNLCKNNNTAVRIGVNHGSLSNRILDKYGNTPAGMVESAMEFLRICKEQNFSNVVVSMKSSNTRVMVYAYRLLIVAMQINKMHYPLHLGLTEAGDGEDGRIKSAVGIGTLLTDGIGDTIRVSLTEKPEAEIPVAQMIISHILSKENHKPIDEIDSFYNPFEYSQFITNNVGNIGGDNLPIVIGNTNDLTNTPDYYYSNDIQTIPDKIKTHNIILDYSQWKALSDKNNFFPLISDLEYLKQTPIKSVKFIETCLDSFSNQLITALKSDSEAILVVNSTHANSVGELRLIFSKLFSAGCTVPVILKKEYCESEPELFQIRSATDLGPLLIDGMANGLFLCNNELNEQIIPTSFNILQASRTRFSKTEYIACPSCGRTLFDIEKTFSQIKKQTGHLKSLKIGIMGCIVNGPGEMADADYGYVGAGKGKVSLYKKQALIKKDIPEKEAINELVSLIKENGDWIELKQFH